MLPAEAGAAAAGCRNPVCKAGWTLLSPSRPSLKAGRRRPVLLLEEPDFTLVRSWHAPACTVFKNAKLDI